MISKECWGSFSTDQDEHSGSSAEPDPYDVLRNTGEGWRCIVGWDVLITASKGALSSWIDGGLMMTARLQLAEKYDKRNWVGIPTMQAVLLNEYKD